MSYDNILVERDGPIATVRFNRPAKANALNHAHLRDIEDAALSFRDDVETRVVIFTGVGKHFSSGADLTDPERDREMTLVEQRRLVRQGERALRALYGMDQITIAAMHGAAMGGGACIPTALDFRVGTDDCFIAYPEIDIGVNLMWTGLPLCTHLVGPARAKRLVIGGERVYAPVLAEWGFIDRMVSGDELMAATLEMARHYASKTPIAAQMIKRSVNAIVSALDHSIMHMDFDQNLLCAASDDAREARAAYLGGRTPTFTGA